jgi:hypothetical protein
MLPWMSSTRLSKVDRSVSATTKLDTMNATPMTMANDVSASRSLRASRLLSVSFTIVSRRGP